MKKCPKCNSTRYKSSPFGKVCKRCGFRNDSDYLRKKNNEDNNKTQNINA